MNTPLDEIRRLREQVAGKDRQLAELRGLVAAHLEADSNDPEVALKREETAFWRGYDHGDEDGWRRGVEHALMEVDRAHWRGDAHTHRGEMRELGMHAGPVPPRMTPEQILAQAEEDNELHAKWWWNRYYEEHPEAEAEDCQRGAKVRQLRPKDRGAEREAGLGEQASRARGAAHRGMRPSLRHHRFGQNPDHRALPVRGMPRRGAHQAGTGRGARIGGGVMEPMLTLGIALFATLLAMIMGAAAWIGMVARRLDRTDPVPGGMLMRRYAVRREQQKISA